MFTTQRKHFIPSYILINPCYHAHSRKNDIIMIFDCNLFPTASGTKIY